MTLGSVKWVARMREKYRRYPAFQSELANCFAQ